MSERASDQAKEEREERDRKRTESYHDRAIMRPFHGRSRGCVGLVSIMSCCSRNVLRESLRKPKIPLRVVDLAADADAVPANDDIASHEKLD